MENQDQEQGQEQEILSVGITGGKKGRNIFFALFFIAIAALTIWTGFELQNKGESVLICVFVATAVLVFGATAIVFFRSEKMPVHRQFALLFAVLGFFYFILVPFLAKNDERNHFLRAFEITRGHFISDQIPGTRFGGQRLPENIILISDDAIVSYKAILEKKDERLSEKLQWHTFENTAAYSPFAYALHLPGLIIATFLTDKPMFMAYAARFSAFFLCWIFLFLIIKKTPYKQKTLLILSLTPIFLYQATAVSADTIINLAMFLSIGMALILAASKDEYKVSSAALLIIALLSFFVTLGKIIYFPIVLVFLLIPYSKFESPKQWKIFFVVLFGICVLSNIGWILFWKLHIATYKTAGAVFGGGDISNVISNLSNSNTGLQFQLFLNNPTEFFQIILEAIIKDGRNAFFEMFAGDFSYALRIGAIKIHWIIPALLIFSIVAVSFSDRYGSAISYARLFFLFSIAALLIAAVLSGIWTKNLISAGIKENVNLATNEGLFISGRYYFPSAVLVLMCLNSKRIKFNSDLILRYCLPIVCFVNLFVLSKIVLHFAR